MKINETYKQLKYNVTKLTGRKITHIVIHNTATTASAQNNCKYFAGGNRNASADFFINKDGSIYLFNADIKNYYSWHAGNGEMNRKSIGIEVVSAGEEFTQKQKDALRELCQYLMKTYGATEVIRHYDVTKKACPAYYVNNSRWTALKNYILSKATTLPVQPNRFVVEVTCNVLNIRKGASTGYEIIGSIKKGERYTIVDVSGSWGLLKAYASGRNGWINISSSYVKRI